MEGEDRVLEDRRAEKWRERDRFSCCPEAGAPQSVCDCVKGIMMEERARETERS